MIKGKYKFDWLNNGLEITDPTLEIEADGIVIFPTKGYINAPILLITDTANFGVFLEDIKVNDFNYDSKQLLERVMTRLNDFKV